MRPALLKLGGRENFAAYQAEFDKLYHTETVTDILGSEVRFKADRCEHVCIKSPDRKWNKDPRTEWNQERAERIPWIMEALKNPYQIRPDKNDPNVWVYMLSVRRDLAQGLPDEYYGVLVTLGKRLGEPGIVHFLTAYNVDHVQWMAWINGGACIYPPQKPKEQKKKKGKAKSLTPLPEPP